MMRSLKKIQLVLILQNCFPKFFKLEYGFWTPNTENTNLTGSIQQFYLFRQTQTSQTGGQPYSDTSTYAECSLPNSNQNARVLKKLLSTKIAISVTRLGDFLQFGQLFKAFGNN